MFVRMLVGKVFIFDFPGHLRDYTTASFGKMRKNIKIKFIGTAVLKLSLCFSSISK